MESITKLAAVSRRTVLSLMAAAAAAAVSPIAAAEQKGSRPGTRIVVDDNGDKVEVPEKIERVVVTNILPLASAVAVYLNDGSRIVGMHPASYSAAKNGLLGELYPEVLKADTGFIQGASLNIEALMALRPDVVLVNAPDRRMIDMIRGAGLAAFGISPSKWHYDVIETHNRWMQSLAQLFPEAKGKGELIEGALRLTVNGGPVQELPFAAGEYEIVVDFSALFAKNRTVYSLFEVGNMGVFDRSSVTENCTLPNLSLSHFYAFSDTVVLCLHIDHWIQNADTYVQKLYIQDKNNEIARAFAFGRELQKARVGEEEYFLLDTSLADSNYQLDIYLTLEYAAGTFGKEEMRSVRLDAFLNGTEQGGTLRFLWQADNLSEPVLVLSDLQELAKYGTFLLPSQFPCEATLVNQVLFFPQSGTFSVDYKAEQTRWDGYGFSVWTKTRDGVYGYENKESFSWEGTDYTVYYTDSGSEFPPVLIVYRYNCLYYQVTVDIQRAFNVEEFIKGFALSGGSIKNS